MVASQKGPVAVGVIPFDTDALIEMMGGAECLREELAEHAERRQRLESMLDELTQQYPDQWAALTEGGELLVAPSLEALAAQLRKLDTRPGSSVVEFLDTDPARWVL